MASSPSLNSLQRTLGTTGIRVSPIGLGTVKLGRNTGVKYPADFDLPSDADATRLLEAARDLGINLIDTAPAYGTAERRLGTLLPGSRDDWVIVTKAGEEFEGGRSRFDFSADAITASVHRSLKRLRTEVLDAVLLHSDGNDTEIIGKSGGLEALARLKEQGHIRAHGISTKTPEGAILAIESRVDVVMITLNPLDTDSLPAVYAAKQRGVGVLVKKPLVSGHVGPAATTRTRLTPEHCIDFALSHPGVTALVVGTIDPEHLRQNAVAAAATLHRPTTTPRGATHDDRQ